MADDQPQNVWQFLLIVFRGIYNWFEARTTRSLGVAQGLLGLALAQCFDANGNLVAHPLIPAKYIAWALFASGAATFLRGQFISNTVAGARSVLTQNNPSDAPISKLLTEKDKLK